MLSARWRISSFPPAARRGLATLVTVIVLAAASATPALAQPPDGSSGQPDNDTNLGQRTLAQAAFEGKKLALAAQIEELSPDTAAGLTTSRYAPLDTSNDVDVVYYGGSGGGDIDVVYYGASGGGSGSGSSGGSTGYTPPPNRILLAVRARHQSEVFWCGPASGQVVINYSRGYNYAVLNGDSTATNWKTQATIASWMKTNESQGTLGSNLTAALNRPDAVAKPIPEWSYVYGKNSDGQDLHSKVVTDVSQFAMPVVIAVMPHKTDAAYWLPSWPREAGGAKHWIVIYGYDGLWDGTQGPQLYYTESAGNGSKNPGQYVVDSYTMWKVNQYNASTIVW